MKPTSKYAIHQVITNSDSFDQTAQNIVIDGQNIGLTFDGIGALSAGGSSRLLYDYPEKERNQLLDYLFKPGYGAALHLLKVEIGSDTNSTSGSEPGHERKKGEVVYDLGYEWWLMKEAKKRNPDIKLAALAWGAPAWARSPEDGGFYSQESIEFYLTWLDCAEQHGLQIDYLGGWNERGLNENWYIGLKKALKERYPNIKIVADDSFHWDQANYLASNPKFKEAVDIVGNHFSAGHRTLYQDNKSTDTAKSLGLPLWHSENAAMSHESGAQPIARALNRMYPGARMTGYISWSLISAWYANLPLADSGLMLAEWPWSGHYRIGKSIWSNAHTTQFTNPGWRYLDSDNATLDCGATYVTLVSPEGDQYSTIIEAMDVKETTKAVFQLDHLPEKKLQVWATDLSSDDQADFFQYVGEFKPRNGAFELVIQPEHIYTISTRTDAGRGTDQPEATIYDQLALPFKENFDQLEPGKLARYFSDVNGGFETAECGGGRDGICYRQMITELPVAWCKAGFVDPTTVAGDPRWWGDYCFSAKVMLEQAGYIELLGRVSGEAFGRKVGGYHLQIGTEGWELYSQDTIHPVRTILATGDERIEVGSWHDVKLHMVGETISAYLDGKPLAVVEDSSQRAGNIGLSTSKWINAQFDDIEVTVTAPAPTLVPKAEMSVEASSEQGFARGYEHDAAKAIDDRPETFWHSLFETKPPHTLTLDLGKNRDIQALLVRPRMDSHQGLITEYEVQVSLDGNAFSTIAQGTWEKTTSMKVVHWQKPVQARYVRLVALDGVGGSASVSELDVVTEWNGPGAPKKA